MNLPTALSSTVDTAGLDTLSASALPHRLAAKRGAKPAGMGPGATPNAAPQAFDRLLRQASQSAQGLQSSEGDASRLGASGADADAELSAASTGRDEPREGLTDTTLGATATAVPQPDRLVSLLNGPPGSAGSAAAAAAGLPVNATGAEEARSDPAGSPVIGAESAEAVEPRVPSSSVARPGDPRSADAPFTSNNSSEIDDQARGLRIASPNGAQSEAQRPSGSNLTAAPAPRSTAALNTAIPAVSPPGRTAAEPLAAAERAGVDSVNASAAAVPVAADALPDATTRPSNAVEPEVLQAVAASLSAAASGERPPSVQAAAAGAANGVQPSMVRSTPSTAHRPPTAGSRALSDASAADAGEGDSLRRSGTLEVAAAAPEFSLKRGGDAAAPAPAPVTFTPRTPFESEPAALQAPAANATAPGASAEPEAGAASATTHRLDTSMLDAQFPRVLGLNLARWARDGVREALLEVHPADMGPVSIQIAVEGRQAEVAFAADSSAARGVIESSLPELASALQAAGLTLSGGSISQQLPDSRQAQDLSGREAAPGADSTGTGGSASRAATAQSQDLRRLASTGLLDLYA